MKPPRLVLLRPRSPENVAAVALAMKTFGLSDWVLVDPSRHARKLLGPDAVRQVATLEEAIADCTWVVGTTMRDIEGRPRFTARELAAETQVRRDETWALVIGNERAGLRNEDLEQCHALSFIPTSDEQPSLNLAQAVVVYAHELSTAPRAPSPTEGPALADDATLRKLRASVLQTLISSGFLRSRTDERHVDRLMASLIRGSLSTREAGLWDAAWRGLRPDVRPG